jgi:hypothetical protein
MENKEEELRYLMMKSMENWLVHIGWNTDVSNSFIREFIKNYKSGSQSFDDLNSIINSYQNYKCELTKNGKQ